jgi:hypothetical protein
MHSKPNRSIADTNSDHRTLLGLFFARSIVFIHCGKFYHFHIAIRILTPHMMSLIKVYLCAKRIAIGFNKKISPAAVSDYMGFSLLIPAYNKKAAPSEERAANCQLKYFVPIK